MRIQAFVFVLFTLIVRILAHADDALTDMGFNVSKIGGIGPLRFEEDLTTAEVSNLDAEDFRKAMPLLAKTDATVLLIYGSPNLASLEGIKTLTHFRYISISDCPQLKSVKAISGHSMLKSLSLNNIDITETIGVSALPNLEHLRLSYCANLTDVSGLKDLPRLRSLELSNCLSLGKKTSSKQWQVITRFKRLQMLQLANCPYLNQLQLLEELPELQKLLLSGRSIDNLTGVASLSKLEEISLQNTAVEQLDALKKLDKLRLIELLNNPALKNISALEKLRSIEQFECDAEGALSTMKSLASWSRLRRLGVPAKTALKLIDGVPSLEVIVLRNGDKSLVQELKGTVPNIEVRTTEQAGAYENWLELGILN